MLRAGVGTLGNADQERPCPKECDQEHPDGLDGGPYEATTYTQSDTDAAKHPHQNQHIRERDAQRKNDRAAKERRKNTANVPGVDGGGSHIRDDEPQGQPPPPEARHEDDERHDHHDSQAEEISTRSEPMLWVTEDPVHLYRQGYEQETGEGSSRRARGHEEVVPGTGVVSAHLLSQGSRTSAATSIYVTLVGVKGD